jgi:hypothetical protein
MSGIFFDLPSVRFLQRFRFLELMLQTFAASLFRSLSAPACALRQVHSRYDEAEFPSASQSAWNEFDSALDESRATDGVPSLFGALRPFNNWKTVKDQHELLFIRKTPTPLARWRPTQRKSGTLSGPQEPAKTQKRRSGSVLPNFSETAARKRKRRHNRAMARSHHRDLRASQNGLKSRRRVSTLATCLSTPPRAISSTCSTALATCKTQRS